MKWLCEPQNWSIQVLKAHKKSYFSRMRDRGCAAMRRRLPPPRLFRPPDRHPAPRSARAASVLSGAVKALDGGALVEKIYKHNAMRKSARPWQTFPLHLWQASAAQALTGGPPTSRFSTVEATRRRKYGRRVRTSTSRCKSDCVESFFTICKDGGSGTGAWTQHMRDA